MAALLLYLGIFRVGLSRARLAVAIGIIVAAVAIAMALVLPLEFSRGLSNVSILTDLMYPILDLTLFSLTMLSLAIFMGGTISRWWLTFGAASVLYVIGDEFFLYQIAAGTYYNGSLDDLIFILGYLTFALAFFAHRREF